LLPIVFAHLRSLQSVQQFLLLGTTTHVIPATAVVTTTAFFGVA
jgi:hypothetical protein